MSIKHKLLSSWHKFLQTNFNTYLRSSPLEGKERRYAHIDIQKQFNQYEKERKSERLALISYKNSLRKKILERELKLIEEAKVNYITSFRTIQNSQLNQQILSRVRDEIDQKQQLTSEESERKAIINKEIAELDAQLQIIEKERNELESVQQQIIELEPDMMIVEGTQKKILLNIIQYYEFQQRHIAGVLLNPETQKSMEIAHYHIQNNLPVKRELIYEVAPELFEQEIGELQEYKRKLLESKRPQLITEKDSIIFVVEKIPKAQEIDKLDRINQIQEFQVYEQLRSQEMEMSDFVYKKAQEFCDKHDEYIQMKENQGLTMDEICDALALRTEEMLSENERQIWLDFKELQKVNQDFNDLVEVNKVRVFKEQRELYIPEFVKQNEKLTQAWVQKWEQIVKNSFDIKESLLVPYNNTPESKLDQALANQAKHDIQSLIEQSNKEYQDRLMGDTIEIRKQDRKQKDEKLVKKLQILSNAMNNLPSDEEMKKLNAQRHKMDDPSLFYRSEEGRIMIDELPKMLFLNNQDPQKFNLNFWAKHFNIEPQKLKNILNFISYPIISADQQKESTRVLRFIQFSQQADEEKKEKSIDQQ